MTGSLQAGASTSALPAVDQALEPAWVRQGSTATQQKYQAGLAFEQMLVQQLSQSLAQTAGLGEAQGGEAESGGEAGASAGGPLSSLLSQALSESVTGAGGLGLAAQLARPPAGQEAT